MSVSADTDLERDIGDLLDRLEASDSPHHHAIAWAIRDINTQAATRRARGVDPDCVCPPGDVLALCLVHGDGEPR